MAHLIDYSREKYQHLNKNQCAGEWVYKEDRYAHEFEPKRLMRDEFRLVYDKCQEFYKDWYIVENAVVHKFDQPCNDFITYLVVFNYIPIIKGWYLELMEAFIENSLTI